MGRARHLLEAYAAPRKQHLRGWEWPYLWQQCQSDALGELCRYSNAVSSVGFAPDGKVLAVTDGDPGFVDLWNVPDRRRIARIQENAGFAAAFSPRGDLLAANANPWGDPLGAEATRGVVRVWRTDNTNLVCQITNATSASTLKFSPDGTRLACLGPFGEAAVWDVGRWRIVRRIAIATSAAYLVGSLDFSPNGKALAIADAAGRLRVVDLDTGTDRFNVKADAEGLTSAAWSPKDPIIACSGGFASGQIRLWAADSGILLGTLDGHKGWICRTVFSADGQRLYSASGDQTIRIWDVGQRLCLAVLKGSTHKPWGLALSPDGTKLVSGTRDGAVVFWSAAPRLEEKQPRVLSLGREPMWPILRPSFGPDSRVIAAPCAGTVCLYDLATSKETERIPALGTNVGVVTYSPNGTLLVSGSTNGWVRVWSCPERRLLQELPAHQTQFYFLGFPADGRHLLSAEVGWPVGRGKSNLVGCAELAAPPIL